MCPACMTTLAVVTPGVTSTGGIATLVMSKLRGKNPLRGKNNMNEERDMDKDKEKDRELRKGLPPNTPAIVSAQEWEAARQQLLVKEKALTRGGDALAAECRRMPWLEEAVEERRRVV
jgi:hypothetical protein